MNLEQLKAAAQAVVDAESAITYAIIAPSADAFDEIVEQRKRTLSEAIYALQQLLLTEKSEKEPLVSLAICMGSAALDHESRPFFSYCPEAGFDTHETIVAARDAAEASVEIYRDEASSDGWNDVVMNVCYGVLVGGAYVASERGMTEAEIERFCVDGAEGVIVDIEVADFDQR